MISKNTIDQRTYINHNFHEPVETSKSQIADYSLRYYSCANYNDRQGHHLRSWSNIRSEVSSLNKQNDSHINQDSYFESITNDDKYSDYLLSKVRNKAQRKNAKTSKNSFSNNENHKISNENLKTVNNENEDLSLDVSQKNYCETSLYNGIQYRPRQSTLNSEYDEFRRTYLQNMCNTQQIHDTKQINDQESSMETNDDKENMDINLQTNESKMIKTKSISDTKSENNCHLLN